MIRPVPLGIIFNSRERVGRKLYYASFKSKPKYLTALL